MAVRIPLAPSPSARRMRALLGATALAGLVAAALATPLAVSFAQTLSDRVSARGNASGDKRMLVEAQELVYDNDRETVTARGNAQVYYQNRILEADRVVYYRKEKRVFAEGNAKITDENGNISYADRFELSDDFRDGFIDSLRVQTPDKTRFSAPRAERTDGETTVFERGTYTACEPCKDDPSKPPLWQVRAKRIISKNSEQMIYYEDATLEFAGVPVAWVPYFSAPDPSVKRKTGVLPPRYHYTSALGVGLTVPYFINLAPNYDLTLSPTVLSRQGFLGEVEWRHRVLNGSYNIRAAGIFQRDPSAFLPPPLGAGDKTFRGSVESAGLFYLNERWKWGWDIALFTDRWFFDNYKVRTESVSNTYFRESISQLYLTGQGERSFFDARGYYFRGLTYADPQKQMPVVHPVIDYHRTFNGLGSLGGELTVTANVTSLSRDAAHFVATPNRQGTLFPQGFGDTCAVYQPSRDPAVPGCIVRGIAGNYTRATAEVSWRRAMIDPIGSVWTPFAGVRADAAFANYQFAGGYAVPQSIGSLTQIGQNAFLPNFVGDDDTRFAGRLMPMLGLEWRYPFIARTAGVSHVVEPIAQLVARPGEAQTRRFPNEDAQSLVFDDTTLFAWNKFSGFDRVEGGTRANLGAQYTATFDSGGFANVLFGQSYQVAGLNSFRQGDIANVGLDSGLETRRSDYVARAQITPGPNFSFLTRARFDEQDFSLKRFEAQASVVTGPVTTTAVYGRYEAQPLIGYDKRREGVVATSRYQVNSNWYLSGSVLFDLDRYLDNREAYRVALANYVPTPTSTAPVYNRTSPFSPAGLSLGAGYKDECTTLDIVYSNSFADNGTGTRERVQTVLLKLELRTLGSANVKSNIGDATGDSGVAPR